MISIKVIEGYGQAMRKPQAPQAPLAENGGQIRISQKILGRCNKKIIIVIFFYLIILKLGLWHFKVVQIRGERHFLGGLGCTFWNLFGRKFCPKKTRLQTIWSFLIPCSFSAINNWGVKYKVEGRTLYLRWSSYCCSSEPCRLDTSFHREGMSTAPRNFLQLHLPWWTVFLKNIGTIRTRMMLINRMIKIILMKNTNY